jgi:hypothetical protein
MTGSALAVALLVGVAAVGTADARRPVAQYVIDLDLPPELRWHAVIHGSNAEGVAFNDTVWGFYNEYFANDTVVTDALYALTDLRGEENAEQQGEVRGLARESGLPLKFVQGIQMLYELQTLQVPIVNCSDYPVPIVCPKQEPEAERWQLPEQLAGLARIPSKHRAGCTGIIARTADGSVAHARNLDFSPVPVMTQLVFTGIFTKGGKEIFRSQMVAGYTSMVTGAKMQKDGSADGFAIERNTRYPDHSSGNEQMLKNLLSGRVTNGWQLRKVLEEAPNYDAAVAAIAKVPYVSTEYAIVSGVRKGMIMAKDPDRVAHTQILGQPNIYQRSDYIIITNFDFFWCVDRMTTRHTTRTPDRLAASPPQAGGCMSERVDDPTDI